jgi:aryl-alcohol dehydrogenase-like predicted oxidoreductase
MYSRREVLSALGAACLASAGELTYRRLGRTGRWVVPFGLGGQGSLQWTPAGIDPTDIIVRAVESGVNYLDTANAYGPSQRNYGAAFRRLGLASNAALRERLYIASKTGQRNGPNAVAELRTSITTMFGAEDAYLDAMQIHNLTSLQQGDQIYAPNGALAALVDYRDGTDRTGLNPEGRRWIRHLGITGHQSSPVLMNALQRDEAGILDTLLVALNVNDRRYLAHQHNVLPVASARNMGIITMKAFADGVFFGKPPRFSGSPADVIVSIEDSTDILRYPLSQPGVACVIAGVGHPDQIAVNVAASQLPPAGPEELRRIEQAAADRYGERTNYFQEAARGLVQPTEVRWQRDDDRAVITWNSALAGAEPIRSYRIYAGDQWIASLPFQPQTTLAPLSTVVPLAWITAEPVRVVASEEPAVRAPARSRTASFGRGSE